MQYNSHKSKTTTILWRWGPAILMMAIIFGFSSIPSDEMLDFGLLDFIIKKGGHALGYGLLGLSYLRGLKGDSNEIHSQWFYIAWVMAILYSATDEFHQSFVPGRHSTVTDVMIDAAGAAMALLMAHRFYKQKRPAIPTSR